MAALVFMLLKLRASPYVLPFSLCNKKIFAIRQMNEQTRLSNDTLDSVLRHREKGRAKDLSSPLLMHYECVYVWNHKIIKYVIRHSVRTQLY